MLTVKCPHCTTALKLRQAPASGKVKCPKCSKVVSIPAPTSATPAAAASRPAPVAAGSALDPDDDAFDFGRINFPSASAVTAVSQFPVSGNVKVYDGPIPGDPLAAEAQQEEGEAEDDQGGGGPARKNEKKKKNPMVLVAGLTGVGILLLVGIGAAAMFAGGGGGGEAKVDVVAAAQKTAPSGYKAVGIEGCVVLMPKGAELEDLPSVSEISATMSSESQSVYLLGAMNGGKRPLDKDQMRKKAERQLGGEILGGNETERNGYKGIKGMLDGSIFLPRMMVEVFHVEERFVIIGCAPASLGADPSMPVDRQLEAAEQKIFYESFKVGPKPSGWSFF